MFEVINYYYEAITAGSVNSMNVGVYEAQFDKAWTEFLNSKANSITVPRATMCCLARMPSYRA